MTSGVMLFVSDYPLHFWPLHFVALVPLFVALLTATPGRTKSMSLGFAFAACYAMPLMLSAGSAPPVIAAAILGMLMWIGMIPCLHYFIQRGPLLGPITCAATVCLFELGLWHILPIFGTAQCFARVTTAAPMLIQFAAYTGLIGVVFVLVLLQALVSNLYLRPRSLRPFMAIVGILLVLGVVNWYRWNRPLGTTVRVAAASWGPGVGTSLKKLCSEAVAKNAQILVTPETGMVCPHDSAEQSVQDIVADVRDSGLWGAIGVFRLDIRKNQALFIEPELGLKAVYEKSHLIPFLENYHRGNFDLMDIDWFGIRCGGMICQDDNFTDLSRSYGQRGTQLMLVPTNDWAPIRGYHLDSSRMRAVECGYAIVRAATGGYSAIISPRGEVLDAIDNTTISTTSIVAGDLVVGDGIATVYAKSGDWPVGIASVMLVFFSLANLRSRRTRSRPMVIADSDLP